MAAYDGEVAHARARRVLRSLSPFTGQEVCFDKTGYVDDVAGKAVGLLIDEAEQAVARYEKHVASARVVPPDEGEDGALFMTGPEGESEEDLWAGAGFDEGEQEVHAGPDRGGFPEPAQNVEAQVKALQEEAAAENDYIDRAMQALGMRQHAGKWKTSCALSEREREQCPRISHRRRRLRAPRWKPVDTWARG